LASFTAQHLAYRFEGLAPPALFYWLRESKTGNAEVDFVTSAGKTIVPIEVKAGKSGSIKSLQQFAIDKKSTLTCRFDLNQLVSAFLVACRGVSERNLIGRIPYWAAKHCR